MPRATTHTENARKQYTDQDSFRWTTPDVKVVAQPVDPMVRQRLNRVESPDSKMAGVLRPQAPLNLSRLIAPPQAYGPMRPISHLDPVMETAMPDLISPVINWIGTHGLQIAEESAKETATKAYLDVQERIANGEDPKKVYEDMRPETMLGFAEKAYDSAAGTAMATYARGAAEKFLMENPHLSVEETVSGVKDIFSDFAVGQSIHFKEEFIPRMGEFLQNTKNVQTEYLIKKGQAEHISNVGIALPELYERLRGSGITDPDMLNSAMRAKITELQTQAQILGIDKSRITETAIDALGSWMVANPEKVATSDDVFGWTKVKDESGFAPEQKYYTQISGWEDKLDAKIDRIEAEAKQEKAAKAQAYVDGFTAEIMDSLKNGTPINEADLTRRAKAAAPDYASFKKVQAAIDSEVKGLAWDDVPAVRDQLMRPFLTGQEDSLPSRQEIDKAWEDRLISRQTRDSLHNNLTAAAVPAVKYAKKELMEMARPTYYNDGDAPSAHQGKVAELFDTLVGEAIKENNGIPGPKQIEEIKKQCREYANVLKDTTPNTPTDFFKMEMYKGDENAGMRLKAFESLFPGVDYEKEQVSFHAVINRQLAAQRAVLQAPAPAPQQPKPQQPQQQRADQWERMRRAYGGVEPQQAATNTLEDFIKGRLSDVNFIEAISRDWDDFISWKNSHNAEALKNYR